MRGWTCCIRHTVSDVTDSSKRGAYLCGRCWETIDRQRITSSSQWTDDSEAEVVWGAFQGALREAIHALKFRHKRGLGRALGRHMARAVGPRLAHVDGIIPLPLHPARVRERGYNQSFEIAYGLAEALDVPLVRGCCCADSEHASAVSS